MLDYGEWSLSRSSLVVLEPGHWHYAGGRARVTDTRSQKRDGSVLIGYSVAEPPSKTADGRPSVDVYRAQ